MECHHPFLLFAKVHSLHLHPVYFEKIYSYYTIRKFVDKDNIDSEINDRQLKLKNNFQDDFFYN